MGRVHLAQLAEDENSCLAPPIGERLDACARDLPSHHSLVDGSLGLDLHVHRVEVLGSKRAGGESRGVAGVLVDVSIVVARDRHDRSLGGGQRSNALLRRALYRCGASPAHPSRCEQNGDKRHDECQHEKAP